LCVVGLEEDRVFEVVDAVIEGGEHIGKKLSTSPSMTR
jgi:hypothetical protein